MSLKRLLIVPDTHAPYHDTRAWNLMLKVAAQFKPDTIVHLGDLWDAYCVSSFDKDPTRAALITDELKAVHECLDNLDGLSATRKVFVEGNHEYRLPRYIQAKAPETAGLLNIRSLFGLGERGWQYVPYKHATKIGKVYFTHDTGNSGKYTTARALEAFQHSVVIGHHHAIQYQVLGDATGQHQVGAQFGWLGDVEQVDYIHRIKAQRQWSLGFGIGYHNTNNGFVQLTPVPIMDDYSCVVEGERHAVR